MTTTSDRRAQAQATGGRSIPYRAVDDARTVFEPKLRFVIEGLWCRGHRDLSGDAAHGAGLVLHEAFEEFNAALEQSSDPGPATAADEARLFESLELTAEPNGSGPEPVSRLPGSWELISEWDSSALDDDLRMVWETGDESDKDELLDRVEWLVEALRDDPRAPGSWFEREWRTAVAAIEEDRPVPVLRLAIRMRRWEAITKPRQLAAAQLVAVVHEIPPEEVTDRFPDPFALVAEAERIVRITRGSES